MRGSGRLGSSWWILYYEHWYFGVRGDLMLLSKAGELSFPDFTSRLSASHHSFPILTEREREKKKRENQRTSRIESSGSPIYSISLNSVPPGVDQRMWNGSHLSQENSALGNADNSLLERMVLSIACPRRICLGDRILSTCFIVSL